MPSGDWVAGGGFEAPDPMVNMPFSPGDEWSIQGAIEEDVVARAYIEGGVQEAL
jgi:hypothetical protein